MKTNDVPAELAVRPQWLIWRLEKRAGKETKVPYRPRDNRKASTTRSGDWATLDDALEAQAKADGIGFVFSAKDPYCGIDLDGCFVDGELHPEAKRLLDSFGSYWERSPSGTGVHAIVKASLNGSGKNKAPAPWEGHIEVYDQGRYFTFTGLSENGNKIASSQRAIDKMREGMGSTSHSAVDGNWIEKARKSDLFVSLYDEGDWSDYDSQSSADLALFNLLVQAIGEDKPWDLMHAFMTSELYRGSGKPGGDDYVLRTLQAALSDSDEGSNPTKFDREVEKVVRQIEVREEARRRVRSKRDTDDAPRSVDGATFVTESADEIVALVGEGDRIFWASGEPLMICAATGVGKTTVAIQLEFRRMGLLSGNFLGLPIRKTEGRVLYIAADRPRQIQRCMKRVVTEKMQPKLRDKLIVWKGPLPFDLGQCERGDFVEWISGFPDVSDVVVDSLKDLAVGLSSDEVGAKVNSEYQQAIAEGYELMSLQHMRKTQVGNMNANSLDDIYGSTWITAGHGSVVYFKGKPESTRLELRHLKPPAEVIGPLDVLIDRPQGTVALASKKTDLVALVSEAHSPLTAQEVAELVHGANPAKGQVEGVRSKLKARVEKGLLALIDGEPLRFWKP